MAQASERSLSEQIELWAEMGKAIEPFLGESQILALRQNSAGRSLWEALREVDSETGRKRVRDVLQRGPFPRFEAVKEAPGLLRKIDEDGSETVGQFVDRVFVPIEP
jgi:hypothetical protein